MLLIVTAFITCLLYGNAKQDNVALQVREYTEYSKVIIEDKPGPEFSKKCSIVIMLLTSSRCS